ncbi:MAG TPA: hypothetical protein PLV91_01455 [Verrucomicrobiota bacterium]|jgi:hypothetical protein|nr:hypothetical protein [Verrucomicrobiota bacterium]
MSKFRLFIKNIWEKDEKLTFSDEDLLDQLKDGSLDTEKLSLTMISALLDEQEPEDWYNVYAVFDSLCATYNAETSKLDHKETVGAIFTICVLSNVLKHTEYPVSVLSILTLIGKLAERSLSGWRTLASELVTSMGKGKTTSDGDVLDVVGSFTNTTSNSLMEEEDFIFITNYVFKNIIIK